MKKMKRKRLFLSVLAILIFSLALFYSAKWVIAEPPQEVKKEAAPVAPQPALEQAPAFIFMGTLGKDDPFVEPGFAPVSGMEGEAGGTKGAAASGVTMKVTGIMKVNGKYYAIVFMGDKAYILGTGDEKHGFKVTYISPKEVTLSGGEGKEVNLSMVYTPKKESRVPQKDAEGKVLAPPPMTKPQEVTTPGASPAAPVPEEGKEPQEKIIPSEGKEGGSK